tara:strand:- start:298 stop:483 length:186 start_codon:yes stop_codon:yes gene_type:complete
MIQYLTFVDELKSLIPVTVIDELTKQNAAITDTQDKINLLINKYEKIIDKNEENENKGILL